MCATYNVRGGRMPRTSATIQLGLPDKVRANIVLIVCRAFGQWLKIHKHRNLKKNYNGNKRKTSNF